MASAASGDSASAASDRILTLLLNNYHLKDESVATSNKINIGSLEWMAKMTIYKQTYIKSDGRPTCWYNYLLEVSCLLPDDTKFYNCFASINHGWYTHARGGFGASRAIPDVPTFQDTLKFRFTHKAPHYRHRITFDQGSSFNENDTKMVVYLKLNLEHDDPPVRAKLHDFSDNSFPWHDLKVVCGQEEKELYTSKSLLAVISPVFQALLYGQFRERGADSIVLPDTTYEDMSELLQHLYPDCRKPITESNVTVLLRMADRYLIDTVMRDCEQYLLFYDPSCSCRTKTLSLEKRIAFANEYRLKHLQLECERELAQLMQTTCSLK